jgi:para-nitrobenzyl esterase
MIALAAALALATTPAGAPVVTTTDGAVAGERMADGRALFRGIPFAAPPLGDLRWRAPRPAAKWQGVRDATKSRPSCPQPDYGWNKDNFAWQDEDCLYLEVGTPDLTPAKPLPVMVWIHGGGNYAGGGAGTVYSSTVSKGIVLVSVQYRLGVLGFLSHPAFSAETPDRTSGNYGLMDQQAALRWVQANIARFGGDPANVTIYGESAGAQDVGLQMLSPGAKGLFAKAIAESGTAGFGVPPRSLAHSERIGVTILEKAGARPGATAAELRALPLASIVANTHTADVPELDDDGFIWLQAVVDGRVIVETPEASLAAGRGSKGPLIIGSNAMELSLHGGPDNARAAIEAAFGANAPAALAFYGLAGAPPLATDPRLGDLGAQLSNDVTFRCPMIAVSRARVRHGMPTWQYHYDYTGPDGAAVRHAGEIPYVFAGADELEPGAPPLQAYWVNFAKTGDPNGPGLPAWPAYDETRKTYLEFANGGPRLGADLRGGVCGLRSAP